MRRVILSMVTISVVTTMIAMASRSYRPSGPDRPEGVQPVSKTSQPMVQITSDRNQPGKAYQLGYRLGECLAAEGCQIFEATIQTLGDPAKQEGSAPEKSPVLREVMVIVDENLAGPGNVPGQRVSLQSVGRPALTKTALGPWNVWENANLAANGKILVALWGPKAPRPTWQGEAEKVAMVTTDTESFPTIREVIHKHNEVEASPEELMAISKGSDLSDQYLLGYLMAYVNKKEVIRNVDTAAKIFSSLLTNEVVPDFVRNDIPARLLVDSYRLSDKTRNTVTKTLVGAAANDNARLSETAIDVLIQLSNDKRFNMQPFITPELRSKLLANYQALLSKRGGSRGEHRSFETQIGIDVPN